MTFGMAFPMGSPLALLFLHISMASRGQNQEIQATKGIWNGVPYGPMGSLLELLFFHISMAPRVQKREIEATKGIWNGLFYGLPTDIAISPHSSGLFSSNQGNTEHQGHLG